MKKFREGVNRSQAELLPARIEDYVSGDDLVRYIDQLTDELDLSEIEASYSNFGRPAYSPENMPSVSVLFLKYQALNQR